MIVDCFFPGFNVEDGPKKKLLNFLLSLYARDFRREENPSLFDTALIFSDNSFGLRYHIYFLRNVNNSIKLSGRLYLLSDFWDITILVIEHFAVLGIYALLPVLGVFFGRWTNAK